MTTYVLVHGALHGAWCWQRVAGPLRDAGHAVSAVDLPGRGETVGAAEFQAYVDVVAAAVDQAEPPVILVGHSFGGVAVSQFVEQRPDAVAALVFVNALLPEDGETVMAKLQAAGEECLFLRPGAIAVAEDGGTISVVSNLVAEGFYNRCSAEDAAWAAAQLCAEPVAPLMVPLRITQDRFGSVPKVYLGSRHDCVLPWWFQEKMSKAAGATLVELTGDHSPWLSAPEELVAQLLEIDRKGT